jgi:hypothetical protein
MRFRHLATLAVTLSIASPMAIAASSAQATLTGLSIRLVDLNPDDGITPWISFNALVRSQVTASVNEPLASQSSSQSVFGALQPVSTEAATELTQASASLGQGGNLLAQGQASGLPLALLGLGQVEYQASARGIVFNDGFTLSPFTQMVLIAQASVTATTTIGQTSQPTDWEYATALASLAISGTGSDGNGSQQANDNLLAHAYWGWGPNGPVGDSESASKTMELTFLNLTSGVLQGYMRADVSVSGNAISAVPEPGGAVMLLAGLGVCGWMLRRRQRT